MRAVVVSRTGGPEQLEVVDVATAVPGPGQVVVDVAAAGVNFLDIYHREGRYPLALPFVPGQEGAGVVATLGPDVDPALRLRVGDRVVWASGPGSYADQVAVDAASVVAVPDAVDLDTAAALMLQGLTAQYLVTSVHPVAAGDVVVVHAAAGGVGLLLTQLASAAGAFVVATVGDAAKADLARAAGAGAVVDYPGLAAAVAAAGDGAGAHAVYDGVGAATFEASLAALRPRGVLALFGQASGPVPPFDLQRLTAASAVVTRPTLRHFIATRAELLSRATYLLDAVAAGALAVRIGGVYPLAEVAQAHTDLAGRATTGKLLLRPGG